MARKRRAAMALKARSCSKSRSKSRCDQDLGPRRDRALRAAIRDPAHALRSALALAAAREDRNRSALALVLRSVRAPKAAKSDLALILRGALAPAPRSALAPDPRSA